MSMKRTMLIGEIMERVSALGDVQLGRMMGELLAELSYPDNDTPETSANQKDTKYVLCVEATTNDGAKIQHPVIGGYASPSCPDDYKMIVGEDLVAMQRNNQGLKSAIESRYPMVHVRYVPVTDEALASLERKLKELIENLENMLEEAANAKQQAYNMMHVNLNSSDITDEMIAEVIRKTIYAGAGLNSNGEVVDRTPEEKYVEEREIERRNNQDKEKTDEDDDEEDEEPDEWDPDTCDGDCGDCDGKFACQDSTYDN